jgi:hypothetical protein
MRAARLWITAMRPRHSRTTSRYAMQTVTSGEKQTPSGHDGPPTGAAADTARVTSAATALPVMRAR